MRNGQCGRGARNRKARSDASMLQSVTMAAARTRRRFARGGVGAGGCQPGGWPSRSVSRHTVTFTNLKWSISQSIRDDESKPAIKRLFTCFGHESLMIECKSDHLPFLICHSHDHFGEFQLVRGAPVFCGMWVISSRFGEAPPRARRGGFGG
jgi:hypothetical protein